MKCSFHLVAKEVLKILPVILATVQKPTNVSPRSISTAPDIQMQHPQTTLRRQSSGSSKLSKTRPRNVCSYPHPFSPTETNIPHTTDIKQNMSVRLSEKIEIKKNNFTRRTNILKRLYCSLHKDYRRRCSCTTESLFRQMKKRHSKAISRLKNLPMYLREGRIGTFPCKRRLASTSPTIIYVEPSLFPNYQHLTSVV